MKLRRGFRQLIEQAEAEIDTTAVADARELHGCDDVVFVDIREKQELLREGKVPDAFHAPRGMLEFWVDPESPYHKPVFSADKQFVLYCASGWRSALATKALVDMGFPNISHLEGGFSAWKDSGGEVVFDPPKA